MTVLASLRDTFEVARFELIRALRTWRAVALTLLFVVATTGAAFVFVGLLWVLEAELASTLGVPTTDRPGAMTGRLMESGELRRMLEAMIGEEDLVDAVLWHPVLALFHLWFCLLLGPFFATTSAAECIAVDNRTRALRFEVLRTGRLELVMGRFIGQVLLTSIAFTAAVLGPWIVGVFFMVGNDPLHLAGSLLWLTPRALAFSLPFVGVGVAASQLTTSPAWARVLAVAGTAGAWVVYGVANRYQDESWGLVCDLVLRIVPQGWMRALWEPDLGWLVPVAVCLALSVVATAVGYLRFHRRDL